MKTRSMHTLPQEVSAKKISFSRLLFLLVLAFVGCSRCEECEYQGGSETLCETEFDNPEQYEEAVADREADGASCTSTGGF